MRPLTKQFFRENLLGLSLTFLGVLSLALAGMFYLGHRSFPGFALAGRDGLNGPEIENLERLNRAYERIAESVTPGVVYIQSTQVVKVQQSPFFADPFFRQFFGDNFPEFQVPRERRERALGSGVIVSPEGYIVTNNHLTKGATSVDVQLADKRFFKAKVVGADPQTDLAVLRIQGKNFPTVPLGDSSTLHVGDVVMAFGNPFGYVFTVTRGAVSALARPAPEEGLVADYIQTDAAINPGNSGGPLVNVRGQVVGINTWIVPGQGPGGQGGFIGIGFAVPSNTVKHVMEDLIRSGKVTRGYLGVQIQSLSEDMARQFHAPDTSGALVQNVTPGGPADKAGLKEGDVVRKINGKPVSDNIDLTTIVTNLSPGAPVTLDVLRDGKPMTFHVTLGERPENLSAAAAPGRAPAESALRGISVQNLIPSLREQLGLPANARGVVISNLDQNSPAAQSGLQPGDVIESINRQPVNNVADFTRLAAEAKGDTLLRINRQGQGAFVVVSPGGDEGE